MRLYALTLRGRPPHFAGVISVCRTFSYLVDHFTVREHHSVAVLTQAKLVLVGFTPLKVSEGKAR